MTGQSFAHRVLILFAHPALQKSRVNRRLMEAVRDLDGITFHDLYELYPDFHIDAEKEQDLPRRHDIIDAGVHHVYRETLDTSLRAGVDALRARVPGPPGAPGLPDLPAA